MSNQIAVFSLGNGVTLHLPINTEPKHYSWEEAQETLENFADKIGASFQYAYDEDTGASHE